MPVTELYSKEKTLVKMLTNGDIVRKINGNDWLQFTTRQLPNGCTKFKFEFGKDEQNDSFTEITCEFGFPLVAAGRILERVVDYFGAELSCWNRVMSASTITSSAEGFAFQTKRFFESLYCSEDVAAIAVADAKEKSETAPPKEFWTVPWTESFEDKTSYNFPSPKGTIIFSVYTDGKVTLRIDAETRCTELVCGYEPEAGLALPREYGEEELELTPDEFVELHKSKTNPELVCLGAGKIFAMYGAAPAF
ncbi:MAG: hypothetical protein ACRDBQ_18955 [Shewanella sp.]